MSKAPVLLRVRALTPQDLDTMVEGPRRASSLPPATLRDVHHMMARLFAMGLRTGQVAERIGYTLNRVATIRNSPAFEALVQHYRLKLDESFSSASYDMFHCLTSTTMMAERMLSDRLVEAQEGGEDAPRFTNKELLAIRADGADRIGYGKRQTQVNLNADFAALLDKAVSRSRDAQRPLEEATIIPDQPRIARRA